MKIKSYEGETQNIDCIGCALQKGDAKTSSGLVYEGKYFEIRQDFELPIAGFFIISSKRHIVGFADFTKDEQQEFIDVLCRLRKIMRDSLGIEYIEAFMRENTIISKRAPSHFHIGLLPRYEWMKKFKDALETFEYAKKNMRTKKNLEEVNKISQQAKSLMNKK